MKEATGELNMTVITVVAIVAVGALFTWFVWPTIKANLAINTACSTLDSSGNSKTSDHMDDEGYVECSSFSCVAYYDNRSYGGNCQNRG